MNRTQTGILFLEPMALTKLRVIATLLSVIGVFAGGVGPVANRSSGMEQSGVKDEQAPNQVSQEVTQVKNDTKKPGATDLYGDPLPAGALARMGTVQLRHGGAAAAFSPDGNVLATVDDKSLRLWSMASGKLLREVKDNYGWGPVTFSPDGKWLATGISESLWLLDAVTGKPVRRIPTAGRVLDFSPDGKLVATSGNDPKEPGSVFLWHTATGKQVSKLRGEQYVHTAAFTPDGRTLLTVFASQQQRSDKIIGHWYVATGMLRKTVVLHLPLCRRPPGCGRPPIRPGRPHSADEL